MLTVPHMIVGAASGSVVGDVPGQNVVAFGVGWLSHYVLDTVPHWERLYRPHDEIDWETEQPTRQWPKHIFIQAALDVIAALSILFIILSFHGDWPRFWHSPLFWGAMGGFFPDFLDNVPFWNGLTGKLPFFKQERRFHQTIHISDQVQKRYPKYLGLLTQLIVVTLGLVWLSS